MPNNPSAEEARIKALLNETHTITLEAPYSYKNRTGTIRCMQKPGQALVRRYITFYGKPLSANRGFDRNSVPDKGSTYARYLMNCHLWKTEGRILKEDEEVDHVNGNALDDRLDNYEIVSRAENIRRRDHMRYASWGITDGVINTLRMHLRSGENRRYIANEMGVPMGYLRYLILNYIPELNAEIGVERDIDDIITRRKEGETCRSIADTYGVDSATIQRFIVKYCPELSGAAFRQDRTAYIIEQAKKGVHYNEIAKVLGCVPTNVWYYIKTKLPDIAKEYKEREAEKHRKISERNAAIVDAIAPFVNKGVTYRELETVIGAKRGMLQTIVTKYDKEKKVNSHYNNRPRSECPTVEEVMEKYPELRGTLPLKQ